MADEKAFPIEVSPLGFGEKDDTLYRAEVGELPSGTTSNRNIELKAKFAEETHHYISECIRVADQKVAFLFAVTTTLLTFLLSQAKGKEWPKTIPYLLSPDTLLGAAIVLLMVSTLYAAYVVFPRLWKSSRCYIFWESISSYPSEKEYTSEAMRISPSEFIRDKFDNCYQLSRLCQEKYRYLNRAIMWGLSGWVFTMLYFLLQPGTGPK
jgi:hypothetical protein